MFTMAMASVEVHVLGRQTPKRRFDSYINSNIVLSKYIHSTKQSNEYFTYFLPFLCFTVSYIRLEWGWINSGVILGPRIITGVTR